ncbi:MAG: transporter substrate-binding domain-containing protein [Vibrio sp.]|uniref:substrate-binding periplasmic protein n=1 Tax=Vibrio sp. TaxID=678 RepID=UPI001ECD3589|nr:transporter substrate-binding domain-containing protein [Vibrio sp.]NRB69011.1 transporter substrate-binding domain-containing protein [Vibrio sp.]
MMLKPLLISGLVLILAHVKAYAAYNMHFFLPDFPPYTTIDELGEPAGIGIDKVLPILSSIGVEYTMTVSSNHGRALSELRKQRSDGFFMASQNEERDEYAVFSAPVMSNRWVWIVRSEDVEQFAPHDPVFKSQAKVTSLLNTNTAFWLKNQGYQIASPATHIYGLIEKLDLKVVDAVLVAESVFMHNYTNLSGYGVILEEEKEFGLYISKHFLAQHPEFMERLNEAIQRLR